MDYKITAPNKNYTGESAGVNFINGEGIAQNGKSIDWFRKKGYTVEQIESKEPKEPKAPKEPKEPKEPKTPKEPKESEVGDIDDSSGNSTEKTQA